MHPPPVRRHGRIITQRVTAGPPGWSRERSGLGNGLANLHNARRARTPIVNIVGDHATYHKQYDAQLESDIATVARNVSSFVRWSASPGEVGADAVDTISAAQGPPGQVATLVLPADVSWSEGGKPGRLPAPAQPAPPDDAAIAEIAAALKSGQPACILVGGRAGRADLLAQASSIAAAADAKLLCETFPSRLQRGAGRTPVHRLAYLAELAARQLEGVRHIVLVDAKAPVSFFAYPGKPSDLVPEGCRVHALVPSEGDLATALAMLAERVGASTAPIQPAARPALPTGALTGDAACAALGALLPEGAILSDEGNTSGVFAAAHTAGAPPHDWLCLTGGAIGQGLPVAVGAAVACRDRKVIALESDGSALYTIQSWWTMARENLDITTILFNNGSYAVLNMELGRVGADAAGPKAKDMLDLSRPDMDFTAIAKGLGLPATRATTADELVDQFRRAIATPGPTVIEAMVPSIV